ncbi:MAG: hypothetical protein KJ952_02705, partial [Candidatus Omnitrophica bacterium]|nr:hypothetical protein [Candidatus Omnitrophota bacterium]
LCFALIGSATVSRGEEPSEDQKICEMKFRKVVILGEVVDTKSAFDFANSYRAAVWYREASRAGIREPGPAMKELISELEGINATGDEWDFIIPNIGEQYFFVTLKNMDKDSLSNVRGTVYLAHSSKNKAIEEELKRVSGENFTVIYGQ